MEFVFTNSVDQDDIFIIQWSSLHRLWVYSSDKNVDDFTMILPNPTGFGNLSIANKFNKLYTTHFCNDYMALKSWLLHMLSLQTFFNSKNLKYMFVNGFNNLLSEINTYRHQEITSLNNVSLSQPVRDLLDFDNRPDDYIIQKINVILRLYNQLNFDNCLKFGDFYFIKNAMDLADDGEHLGKLCNAEWASEILTHLRNNNFAS